MGFSSLSGKARTDPNSPRAFGVCDRCGDWRNLIDLQFQYEYLGPQLVNTNFRVCCKCLDVPALINKPLSLPPDPLPVYQPRLEPFLIDEYGTPITNWDQTMSQWDDINTDNTWS